MKFSLVESRLFGSICYGYKRDKHGLVEVVPEQAEVVRTVFSLYKAGNSLEAIQGCIRSFSLWESAIEQRWTEKLLNNGKYTKGIIKFEEYCDVYFLKGENCRNPNQAKVMKTHAKSNQRRIGVGTRPDQREVSGACE